MYTTLICDFADLHPTLHDYLNEAVRADGPVLSCIQAREDETGHPPKYYSYLLTQNTVIWASDSPIGSIRKYLDIEEISEKITDKGDLFYVEVKGKAFVARPDDIDRFHFENPDKAHTFANLLRRVTKLEQK